jgi:hypothetical protein
MSQLISASLADAKLISRQIVFKLKLKLTLIPIHKLTYTHSTRQSIWQTVGANTLSREAISEVAALSREAISAAAALSRKAISEVAALSRKSTSTQPREAKSTQAVLSGEIYLELFVMTLPFLHVRLPLRLFTEKLLLFRPPCWHNNIAQFATPTTLACLYGEWR